MVEELCWCKSRLPGPQLRLQSKQSSVLLLNARFDNKTRILSSKIHCHFVCKNFIYVFPVFFALPMRFLKRRNDTQHQNRIVLLCAQLHQLTTNCELSKCCVVFFFVRRRMICCFFSFSNFLRLIFCCSHCCCCCVS